MTMQEPVRLQVTLPGKTYAWLRGKAAARKDGSMAAVIRQALEQMQEDDNWRASERQQQERLTESPLSALS